MKAFLFTGLASQYFRGQIVDSCSSLILYGADEDAAWKKFEEMLSATGVGEENPTPAKIVQMNGAPMLDQLLAEAGPQPIDWPALSAEILANLEVTAPDDQEHGYWVECDPLVRPGKAAADVEALRSTLPEDVRSGLNWSAEKTYFFLISVLAPPQPRNPELDAAEDRELEAIAASQGAAEELRLQLLAFPQLANKSLAVIIKARNSAVAAWLWRKFSAETELAKNSIRADAVCDIIAV
jgi:hypothetical protein